MIPTITVRNGLELVVVGDIHENEYHFDQMLERAEVGTKRILVSVGDVYDKGEGSHVAERIIRKIQELNKRGFGYMVRGNHEQRNIKKAKERFEKSGKSGEDYLTPELRFCKNIPLVLSFIFPNQNRVTVMHAGVSPHHTWKNVSTNTEVMYIRSLDDKGYPIPLVWSEEGGVNKLMPERNGVVWHEMYDGRFGYIISGHDSQRDGKVKYYKNSCNIDTRCYDTGILAGQIISDGNLKELITISNRHKNPL